MTWLLFVVAAVFVLIGLVCLVLVVAQLPGGWIMLGVALVIEVCDQWYLSDPPASDQVTFGWAILIGCTVALLVGELIEFLAGVLGAKKAGASKAGMWGSLIGGIVGALALPVPLAIIPIIGPIVGVLLGAVVGSFVGAVIGEVGVTNNTVRGSMKPATGAAIGRALGTAGKVGVALAVWLALSVAAFWP